MFHQQFNVPRGIWIWNKILNPWRGRADTYAHRNWILPGNITCLLIWWIGEADARSTQEKKNNTQPGNIPVIQGVCLILTCNRHYYSYRVCNRNICWIYPIEENHILHWRIIWLLPLHADPFKTRSFLGLFFIMNKYSATMKTYMHCSHPILRHSGYCLRDEAFAC